MKNKFMQQLSLLCIFTIAFTVAKAQQYSLEEAKQFAVEHSYQAQTADLEVDKSRRKVKETISTGLPQVNATASYQNFLELPRQLVPAEFFGGNEGEFAEVVFGTEQQMGFDLRATQLLFDGSYFVGLQASKVYLELSKNDQRKTETEIKQMVTQAYGNVLVTEENIEILKQNMENLQSQLEETKALYENGFAEEQDRDQLELLLSNAKNAYEQSIRQKDISRNQLKFMMGIDITTEIELTDDLDAITIHNSNEDFLSKEFDVTTHIDYKVINTQERASELLLKQQKSTYLPKLSAFASYQQNSYSNEFNFFDDSRWFPTEVVGLNFSMPIFSSFGRNQRVQQAKIEMQQVGVAKKQVEQKLLVELETARSEYTFALSQYQTAKDNLTLAERIFNKTQIKYDEGVSSSMELTQANNQLLDTQGNYINASLQLINAKSNIDKALNNY
jgi:outer membrane protein TolC